MNHPYRNHPKTTPTAAAVLATTLPGGPWDGWYCGNHPGGEELANAANRPRCWGCGLPRPTEDTPGPRKMVG